MKLFICCVICLLAANWVVEDTDSSERLIINVCRNISRVDADVSCPSSAAVCLVSEYKLASTVFDLKKWQDILESTLKQTHMIVELVFALHFCYSVNIELAFLCHI